MSFLDDALNVGTLGLYGLGKSAYSKSDTPDAYNPNAANYDYMGGENQRRTQLDNYKNDATNADRRGLLQPQSAQSAQALGLAGMAAQGLAPSAAQIQSQAAVAQAAQLASQQAASTRGGGGLAFLAQQNAQRQAASNQLANARDNGALRAQEMGQARGQYLQGAQASDQQRINEYLSQTSLNDTRRAYDQSAQAHIYDQTQAGQMGLGGAQQNAQQFAAGQQLSAEEAEKKRQADLFQAGINTAAKGGAKAGGA